MVKKKGQALVEFIIILPLFILLILGIIDIGRIMYYKITIEEQMSDVVDYYKTGKNIAEIKDKFDLDSDEVEISLDNEFVNIKITKKVDIITPGIQLVLDNPYAIITKRSILNE